jgi:polyhydroxyalkanoate synthase subunit PhaC
MPGGVFRQLVRQWIQDNGFVTDRLRFDGRRAAMANVRVPLLAVVAERDDIVPVESALAVVDALPNAHVELLRVDAGHVSLFAGRQAVKVVMPQVFQWLEDHSEEAA